MQLVSLVAELIPAGAKSFKKKKKAEIVVCPRFCDLSLISPTSTTSMFVHPKVFSRRSRPDDRRGRIVNT